MPKMNLNEKQRNILSSALMVAAEQYAVDARSMRKLADACQAFGLLPEQAAGYERLANAFDSQVSAATDMASQVDDAETIVFTTI